MCSRRPDVGGDDGVPDLHPALPVPLTRRRHRRGPLSGSSDTVVLKLRYHLGTATAELMARHYCEVCCWETVIHIRLHSFFTHYYISVFAPQLPPKDPGCAAGRAVTQRTCAPPPALPSDGLAAQRRVILGSAARLGSSAEVWEGKRQRTPKWRRMEQYKTAHFIQERAIHKC
jgi:hypothetical protein